MSDKPHFSDYESVTRSKPSSSPGDQESPVQNGFDSSSEEWGAHARVNSLFETDEQPMAGNEVTQSVPRYGKSGIADPEELQKKFDSKVLPSAVITTMADGLPAEKWSVKRGHSLSFVGLFVFTCILYYRPYEYISVLSSFTSMAFWPALLTLAVFFPTQLALEGTLTARPREITLALLLALTALLSIPFAISPGEGLKTFVDPFIKAILMFIVIVNAVRTERRLKWLMFLGLSVGFVLSLGALNDYRLGNLTVEGYRVGGIIGNLFGNPNDMAIHLVTMLPIAVALGFSSRSLSKRLLYGAGVVLLVVGTVLTFSRAGFLGLAAAAMVLAWKIGRRNRFAIVVLMGLAGATLLVLAPGNYGNRLLSIYDSTRDAFGSSLARRETLIRSIVVALRHPLFGIGIGNFHIMSVREAVSHNAYTQVASEMGLAAMTFYIMFIVTPIRRLRRIEQDLFTARHSSRIYYLSIGLQASLIAFMVSSFFASVAYQWYIYYLVGYAVALRRIYLSNPEASAAAEPETTYQAPDNSPADKVRVGTMPKKGAAGALVQ